ncbi:hypothetical protein CMO84_08870, partial [Candidatus Woesearchaeota archaeon]|nr:hypothetical protein [Candidatus Woesearchaeota archaeon]
MGEGNGTTGAAGDVDRGASQLVDHRALGGAYPPDECARRVNHFFVVETLLMRSLAGWIARCPELDIKIELGRQVAFSAERADALLRRVA